MIKLSRKGFTLIELIIVLTVIGVILGIAIPAYKGMKDEANLTKARGDLNTLKTAVTSYYKNNGNTMPANIAAALTGATPKIINNILSDPYNTDATTTPKTYGYISGTDTVAGDYFIVYSKGPNGIVETSWDATNHKVTSTGDDIEEDNQK